jgi:hypothetical protein
MKRIVLFATLVIVGFTGQALALSYSEAVQKHCRQDYKKYCGEYGLETNALRNCMDRHGDKLSKSCVEALIQSGEVSRKEVERRRKASRR